MGLRPELWLRPRLVSADTCHGYGGKYGKIRVGSRGGGLFAGIVFLMIMDKAVPHLHLNAEQPEGPRSSLSKTMMMVMAVVLHNIPEGMAVGVVFAGVLTGENDMTPGGSHGAGAGNRYPELSGGSDYFPASAGRRPVQEKVISVRAAFRGGGAAGCAGDDPSDRSDHAGAALPACLCGGVPCSLLLWKN